MRLICSLIRIGIFFFLSSAALRLLLNSTFTRAKGHQCKNALVSFQFIDRARHLQKQQKPILPEVSPTATALAEVRNYLFQPGFRNIYVCRCLLYFSKSAFTIMFICACYKTYPCIILLLLKISVKCFCMSTAFFL